MAIDQETIRWATSVEVDPETGLPNKSEIPVEVKNTGLKRNQPLARQWLNNQFNALYQAFVTLQGQVDSIVAGQVTVAMDAVYPVGSVFMSFDGENPATALGIGVWDKVEGSFLVGVDSTDPLFDTAGEEGGSKSHTHGDTFAVEDHTLTLAEIPTHDHDLTLNTRGINTASEGNSYTPDSTGNTGTVTTDSVGEGSGHNHNLSGGIQSSDNLPPYTAVHIFKRVS